MHFRKEILKNDHFLVTFAYAVPALLRMKSFCFWAILRHAQKKCVFHIPVRDDPGVVHIWEHSNPTRVDKYFPTEHISFVFGTDHQQLYNLAPECSILLQFLPFNIYVPKPVTAVGSRGKPCIQHKEVQNRRFIYILF